MKILTLPDVAFPDTIDGAGRVVFQLSHELIDIGINVKKV